jgi:predicted alpha/beta hydrolase family esterase
MRRQVLFIQGGGARVHDEWDGMLVGSLRRELGPSYEVRYPRMPNEDDPSYAIWRATLRKEFASLNDGAIVVGHSIGGTILINVLAEQPLERELGAIILIAAPFVGEGGWQPDDWQPQREMGEKAPAESRYTSTMALRMTRRHRRMLNSMRTRFHRPTSVACPAAIISSTTISGRSQR